MNKIKETIVLLKKNGLYALTVCMVAGALISIALLIKHSSETYAIYILLFGMIVCWNISDARKDEKIRSLNEKLAEEKDKYVLVSHEMERLRLEQDSQRRRRSDSKRKSKTGKTNKNENKD